jgi:hypothetical protein
MKIQHSWESHVSLESVAKPVESFFASKNFKTKTENKNQEYYVMASGPNERGSIVRIDARIFREDTKVFLELSAGESAYVKMSALTRLIGGGYPMLQAIKAEEMLNKIESAFFAYVGEKILEAGNPSP